MAKKTKENTTNEQPKIDVKEREPLLIEKYAKSKGIELTDSELAILKTSAEAYIKDYEFNLLQQSERDAKLLEKTLQDLKEDSLRSDWIKIITDRTNSDEKMAMELKKMMTFYNRLFGVK